MTCGIYTVINKVNGHQYIGSSANIERRWGVHLCKLRKGNHHSNHLQNAWNKYGEEKFEFVVLLECNKEQLLDSEQETIDSIKPIYNLCPVAGSVLGIKRSLETRRKTSEANANNPNMLGHYPSEETRKKLSEARKGRVFSEETRMKISMANKGRKHTLEARQNMSIAQIGNSHPGHKCSAEARQNMSNARIGNQCALGHHYQATEETRKKLSESGRGKQNMLGHHHSEETKLKMSMSHKARTVAEVLSESIN